MAPDYRNMLRSELSSRRERNDSYSLRAMARQVGLSPAFLSEVLNGKKSLGERRAVPVAKRLGWPDDARQLFVAMVRFETAVEPDARRLLGDEVRELLRRPEAFQRLSLPIFDVISNWYHFAILELTLIAKKALDAAAIARRLGISRTEATAAIERLRACDLIDVVGGKLIKRHSNYTTGDVPSAALRKNHRQMLDKAKAALLLQPVEARSFSGIQMAIDPDRLPEAKARIAEFRRELMSFLEGGDRRALYHLGIQLFRIDKEESDAIVSRDHA